MLSVKQLSKFYGQQQVLDEVSFDIQPGEIVALLGANGSGKTTIIRSICRLIDWEQGDISFESQSIKKSSRYLAQVGAVLEGSRNTHWRLTASQNAQYFSQLKGADKDSASSVINDLQQRLGLEQYRDKEVGKLSTGNKQKVALLCALSYQPKLLLLDEPTLGLDIETVKALQSTIIEQANSLSQAFLITSHDLTFIDKICTRVMVLDSGRIIFNGALDELKQQLHSYELSLTLNDTECEQLYRHIDELWQDNAVVTRKENHIMVQYDQPIEAFSTIKWLEQHAIIPLDLRIQPLSIEMAYHSLLTKEKDQ